MAAIFTAFARLVPAGGVASFDLEVLVTKRYR